jgi:catechol 2,3-dioxygenase-like lactoylglutathione lyase family enzyme
MRSSANAQFDLKLTTHRGSTVIPRHFSLFALIATLAAAAAIAGPDDPSLAPATQKMPAFGSKSQEILLTKITVSDLVGSYDFYTNVLGMKLVTTPNYPLSKAPTRADSEQEHVEIPLNFSGSIADPIFLLIKQRGMTPSKDFSRMTTIGFKVQSRAEVVMRASQAGYKPLREISVLGATVSFIPDPDGYTLEIF